MDKNELLRKKEEIDKIIRLKLIKDSRKDEQLNLSPDKKVLDEDEALDVEIIKDLERENKVLFNWRLFKLIQLEF